MATLSDSLYLLIQLLLCQQYKHLQVAQKLLKNGKLPLNSLEMTSQTGISVQVVLECVLVVQTLVILDVQTLVIQVVLVLVILHVLDNVLVLVILAGILALGLVKGLAVLVRVLVREVVRVAVGLVMDVKQTVVALVLE